MKTLKNLSLSLAFFAFVFSATAQITSLGFNFQGYALDENGAAVQNQTIAIKYTIATDLTAGDAFNYTEAGVSTDDKGVFHITIGGPTITGFDKLDFYNLGSLYKLKVEIKKSGSTSWTTVYVGALQAVPYARAAGNGVPVGTVVAYVGILPKVDDNSVIEVKEGWLLCNGASITESDYPALYQVVGINWREGFISGRFLPDLRGYFLRGLNTRTTGLDANRSLGSQQQDTIQLHGHEITDGGHSHKYYDSFLSQNKSNSTSAASGREIRMKELPYSATGFYNGVNAAPHADNRSFEMDQNTEPKTTNITINNTGATETRPINKAIHYIIKY